MDSKSFLKTVTTRPGVYQMLNADGKVIYVGKAKNLQNRLRSYFQKNVSVKTARMIEQVVDIKLALTETENEALLLECNLIKKYRPRYNVLLRDDKTYPYIYISNDEFPRLDSYRGNKTLKGQFFGPYPSVGSIKQALNFLQKTFLVRQCKNSFFRNRSRPCLQHQIGRCKAPCVGLVSNDEYQADVQNTILFLQGKEDTVIEKLQGQMVQAATQREYEKAATLRDKIANLRQLQEQQAISSGDNDADIMALAMQGKAAVVMLLKIRQGRLLANQAFYPQVPKDQEPQQVMQSFLSQFYLTSHFVNDIPSLIICNLELEQRELTEEVIAAKAGRKVTISYGRRGERLKWLKLAMLNAENALKRTCNDADQAEYALNALQQSLELLMLPQRIECFDISHISGAQTYASCVVYDNTGINKSEYRRFKITGVKASDDYAAMHQALTRRYKRLLAEEKPLPDILLVDGGKGQMTQAEDVLKSLNIETMLIVGIAKGPTRKPGLETIIVDNRQYHFAKDNTALQLLQRIRDEAHRFAITGHRQARQKAANSSRLEDIAGIGASKRRALLNHFGGLQGVKKASIDELCKVAGVNQSLAHKIYDAFHQE